MEALKQTSNVIQMFEFETLGSIKPYLYKVSCKEFRKEERLLEDLKTHLSIESKDFQRIESAINKQMRVIVEYEQDDDTDNVFYQLAKATLSMLNEELVEKANKIARLEGSLNTVCACMNKKVFKCTCGNA